MIDIKLGPIETRFAEIIWANEPLTTNQLTKLCAEALEWKRTTTYTVLKKLSEKGLFKTENSIVTSPWDRYLPAGGTQSAQPGGVRYAPPSP